MYAVIFSLSKAMSPQPSDRAQEDIARISNEIESFRSELDAEVLVLTEELSWRGKLLTLS